MSPSWSSGSLQSTPSPLLFPRVLLSRCAPKLTLLHVGEADRACAATDTS